MAGVVEGQAGIVLSIFRSLVVNNCGLGYFVLQFKTE